MKFICHVTSHNRYVTLLLDVWLLIRNHPFVNFDSRRSRENEFPFFMSCMTLIVHAINRLCDYVDNTPVLEPTILSNLVVISLTEVEI